jgi:hypothetical protein
MARKPNAEVIDDGAPELRGGGFPRPRRAAPARHRRGWQQAVHAPHGTGPASPRPRPPGSPAECGPLSACPRPSLSVYSHHEYLGSQATLGVSGRILLPRSVTCSAGRIPSAAPRDRIPAQWRVWR